MKPTSLSVIDLNSNQDYGSEKNISECETLSDRYIILRNVGGGTFGFVYKAESVDTKEIFAVKELNMPFSYLNLHSNWDREIHILSSCEHKNILKYLETLLCTQTDSVNIVLEYLPYCLRKINKFSSLPFEIGQVRFIMEQVLEGVVYLHTNNIIHRDIKDSNILMDKQGIVKIADFGSAEFLTSATLNTLGGFGTLKYNAIEILLGCGNYTKAVDIWSIGCLFATLLKRDRIFDGKTAEEVLKSIFGILGVPLKSDWPGVSKLPRMRQIGGISKYGHSGLRRVLRHSDLTNDGFNLLKRMLRFCPVKRITASEALKHPYFTESSDSFTLGDMKKWLRVFDEKVERICADDLESCRHSNSPK